jgi:hypothetical protein
MTSAVIGDFQVPNGARSVIVVEEQGDDTCLQLLHIFSSIVVQSAQEAQVQRFMHPALIRKSKKITARRNNPNTKYKKVKQSN